MFSILLFLIATIAVVFAYPLNTRENLYKAEDSSQSLENPSQTQPQLVTNNVQTQITFNHKLKLLILLSFNKLIKYVHLLYRQIKNFITTYDNALKNLNSTIDQNYQTDVEQNLINETLQDHNLKHKEKLNCETEKEKLENENRDVEQQLLSKEIEHENQLSENQNEKFKQEFERFILEAVNNIE